MNKYEKVNYTQLDVQNTSELKWKCRYFTDMTVKESSLLLAFKIRIYGDEPEKDILDEESYHIMAFDINEEYIYAYSRITPAGKKYSQPLITRLTAVKTVPGLKALLVRKTVNKFRVLYGSFPEAIAPDLRLSKEVSVFYVYSSGHNF